MTDASDVMPRCDFCTKLLGEVLTRPWVIRCPRCKEKNQRQHSTNKNTENMLTDDRGMVHTSQQD